MLYTYDGWIDVSYLSGEVKDPRRHLSRGLGYGVAGVTLLYVIVNVALLRVMPLDAMRAAPTTVATDVARVLFGPTGGSLLHGLIILSIFGAMGGLIMTLPRLYYAAAAEYADETTGAPRAIFRALSVLTPRSAVPAAALLLSAAAATVALVFFGTFSRIVNFFVVPLQLNNILLVAAVFRLRRSGPGEPGYRAPGYPVLPLVYIAVIGFFLVSAIVFRPYRDADGRRPDDDRGARVLADVPEAPVRNGYGVPNAYGTLARVLMHRPGPELDFVTEKTIDEFHFARSVDRARFVADYDAMLDRFRAHGVEPLLVADVLSSDRDALSYMARRPNMTYTRDLAVVLATGAVLMSPWQKGRQGDQEMMARAFRRLGIPILAAIEAPGYLEGGGVTMIGDDTLVASLCDRATPQGLRTLREAGFGAGATYSSRCPSPPGTSTSTASSWCSTSGSASSTRSRSRRSPAGSTNGDRPIRGT